MEGGKGRVREGNEPITSVFSEGNSHADNVINGSVFSTQTALEPKITWIVLLQQE